MISNLKHCRNQSAKHKIPVKTRENHVDLTMNRDININREFEILPKKRNKIRNHN